MSEKIIRAINRAYSSYLKNQNLEEALSQILELLADPCSDEHASVVKIENPGQPDSYWTTLSSIGTFQSDWKSFIHQAIREVRQIQTETDKQRILSGFPIYVNGVFSALLILAVSQSRKELIQPCMEAISDFVAYGLEEETRLHLEKNLIEQTYLLALTEKIAKLGHWKINLETKEVTISDEVYRILGLKQGDFAPTLEGLTRFYHPEDQSVAENCIREAISNQSEFNFELRINPQLKPNMVVKTLGFCPDHRFGDTSTIIGTIQDVTERVAQTNALQESEETLEKLHLITSNNEMTLEEKILSMLRMCSQKFKTPYAILGKNDDNGFEILQAISPNPSIAAGTLLNRNLTHYDHLLKGLEPIAFESREKAPFDRRPCDDKIRFEAFIGAPIFVNSKIYGTISFSDTKKREEAFTPKDLSLLQIVASWIGIEKSREEFQKNLQIQKEKAEQASRAKSEFLVNVSHELLTPTNGVIGLANLMAETDLDQKQAQLIRGVIDSGNRLLSLVTDILDMLQLEEGRVLIQKHPFPLTRLLDQVVRETTEMLQGKNIELKFEYDSTLPDLIVSDENRLKRILSSLTHNAVKFTEQGEIRIQVLQHQHDKIQFIVSDTGTGIEEEKLPTIFQKFGKGDSSTKQKHGGMGLGLAITYKLVNLLGGSIGVESTPEEGSSFWFTIEKLLPDNLPVSPYLRKDTSFRLPTSGPKHNE